MSDEARAFADALERERVAAASADVDALTQIQLEKQALLSQMPQARLGDSDISELISRAQANIGLIRHLVVCLRGCVDGDAEPTYTAAGERVVPGERGQRGVL
jgi:hypothetical protein